MSKAKAWRQALVEATEAAAYAEEFARQGMSWRNKTMQFLKRHKKEIVAIIVAVLAILGLNLASEDIIVFFE